MIKETVFDLHNYYGSLSVKQEGEDFYWGLENWDGMDWKKIPKELYDALMMWGPKDGDDT